MSLNRTNYFVQNRYTNLQKSIGENPNNIINISYSKTIYVDSINFLAKTNISFYFSLPENKTLLLMQVFKQKLRKGKKFMSASFTHSVIKQQVSLKEFTLTKKHGNARDHSCNIIRYESELCKSIICYICGIFSYRFNFCLSEF